jgi:3-oxoadipate enol-lactonase
VFIHFDTIGAINVAATAERDGPPLLLLHPVGLDLTWWGPQFEAFGHERQMIAFDMPGHGQSDGLSSPPTFELMAQIAANVLEKLGGRPTDVVGVSVGGMIAQTLALLHPGLVRSLTLVATLSTFSNEVRQALRERARVAREQGMAQIADLSNERWFTPAFRTLRPDMMARTRRSLLLQPGEFHAAMWDMIAALELEAQIPAISCPTLVVTGTADVNAPPAAAKTIADAIPGATLRLMAEIGHFPPFEVPDAFNAILGDFLRTVDAQTL